MPDKEAEQTSPETTGDQLATAAETSPETQETDWKAEVERLKQEGTEFQQRYAKLEADYRSLKGDRQKQGELSKRLDDLHADVRGNQAAWKALAEAVVKDGGVSLPERMAEVETQQQTSAIVRRATRVYENLMGKIEETAQSLGIDATAMPEVRSLIERWDHLAADPKVPAIEKLGLLAELQADIISGLHRVHDAAQRRQAEETRSRGKAAAAQKMQEEAAALDTGPGAGGGGRTATPETIDRLWVDWERKHPDQLNPYTEQYRAILRR